MVKFNDYGAYIGFIFEGEEDEYMADRKTFAEMLEYAEVNSLDFRAVFDIFNS
jgi:hypothetical protein